MKIRFEIHIPDHANVPRSACPHCGVTHECATGVGDKEPHPGAVALCIECGEWNAYDDTLRLVKIDPMELLRFQLDPEAGPKLALIKRAWREVKILSGEIKA